MFTALMIIMSWVAVTVVWRVIYQERRNEYTKVSNGLALWWVICSTIPVANFLVTVLMLAKYSQHFTIMETFAPWFGRKVYKPSYKIEHTVEESHDSTGPFF